MKTLTINKFFGGAYTLTLLLGLAFFMTSCGSSGSSVSSTTTTTLVGVIPGGSTVATNVEQLEDQFEDLDIDISRSYESAWGFLDNELSQDDGLWFDYSVSGDSFRVQMSDAEDTSLGSKTFSKNDILDQIFDNDTELGRSRSVSINRIPLCLLSAEGQVEQKLAYEVIHTLTNGNTVVHIVSPDLPLYLNPLLTAQTDSVEFLRILSTQRTSYTKALTWIGNQEIRYYCQ